MEKITEKQLKGIRLSLKELGLKETQFKKETLDTGMTKGETCLSVDPGFASAMKPEYITVSNAAQLKQLGGVPDKLYETGVVADHLPIPKPWLEENNALEREDVQEKNRWDLCAAYEVYLYGNSKHVASYADMIQKFYYPFDLPVFMAENVVVRKGHPLVIRSPHNKPVAIGFKTLTLEAGARVVCMADVGMRVWNLAGPEDGDEPGLILSMGTDGGNGINGANGASGANGAPGQSGLCRSNVCEQPAGPGGSGTPGGHGMHAANGGKGDNGFWVTLRVDKASGRISLGNAGGTGGNGGGGGSGGSGGNGGHGGAASLCCPGGRDGSGGNGGDAGNGGSGGDGGDGTFIYVTVENQGSSARFTNVSGPSHGGSGGPGGLGGAGGLGNPMGRPGINGRPGMSGAMGKPGSVIVNGKPI
jgi:hypothetical protein